LKVKLQNGNVANRVLPVRIHDLDILDIKECESVLGGVLRGVDFIFRSTGVNRPLLSREENPQGNLNHTNYRDQIKKVALSIKETILGLKNKPIESVCDKDETLSFEERQTINEKSIIVLPFENMSSDPEQEYFSDGLTEEVITDLSHMNDLLVISRNSAMTFKRTNKKTREIAREVNVRYVLEGSVRKSGHNLRITAQLIDASSDTHIWAEKYNGTLDNIFDIQEKVSLSIADSLKVKFSEDKYLHKSDMGIKDPFVYELYLKARYENWQFNELSFAKSEELLKQGLKIAGDNELLYSELCHVNVQYVNNMLKDPDTYRELLTQADLCARKALSLNPHSASAYYAQGLAFYQSCHPKEAIESWRKAIDIAPNHSEPMLFLMLGFMYSMTGLDLKEAEKLLEKSRMIDPLTPLTKTSQGWRLFFEGKFQESLDEFADWQNQLEQFKSPFMIWFVWSHGLNRNYKEAEIIIDQMAAYNPRHILSSLGQFMKYSWRKERQEALNMVSDKLEKAAWWDDGYSLILAEGFSVLKEYEKAFHWLNRAIDYGITNIPFLTEYDHFLENLRNDEQFDSCIHKARTILDSMKE
jgi:TolB-like protein